MSQNYNESHSSNLVVSKIIFPSTYISNMINDYEQRVEDMASRLPILQAKFEDLRSASVQNQIALRSDLASKVSSAVDTLTKLAQLICGQPDRFSPHPEIKITIEELNSSCKETNKAAKKLLDNINNNYINVCLTFFQ